MKPLPHDASALRETMDGVVRLLDDDNVTAAVNLMDRLESEAPVTPGAPLFGEWCMVRARLAHAEGRYADAVREARACLDMIQSTGSDAAIADVHRLLGGAYLGMGVTKSARMHARDAIAIYRRIGDQNGVMHAANDLARIHFVSSEYTLAIDFLNDAVEIARQTGNHERETAFIGNLGRIYLLQGQWQLAHEALSQACGRAERAGKDSSTARNLLSLGYLGILRHEFEASALCLDRALQYIERAGLVRERSIHFEYTGWWHFEQRHWIQAKEDFRSALQIGQKLSSENDLVSQSLRGLAECEAALGDWPEAQRLAESGLSVALEIGERVEVGCLYRVIAEAMARRGDVNGAQTALSRAQENLDVAADPYESARFQVVAARVLTLLPQSEPTAIVDSLREALNTFERLGASAQATEVCILLVEALRSAGRLDEAIQYARAVERQKAGESSGSDDVADHCALQSALSKSCVTHALSSANEFRLGGVPWAVAALDGESRDDLQQAVAFFRTRINASRAVLLEVTVDGARTGSVVTVSGANEDFARHLGEFVASPYQRELPTDAPRFYWSHGTTPDLTAHFSEHDEPAPVAVISVPVELGPGASGLLYADVLGQDAAGQPIRFGPRDLDFAVAFAEIVAWRSTRLRSEGLHRDVRRLRDQLANSSDFPSIITQNEALRDTLSRVRMVVDTDVSILLLGETGTGKDLLARAIHFSSDRRDHRFVSVNCAALPESLLESELFGVRRGAFTGADRDKAGLFAEADGGTFFLDEIGEMPVSLQAKLLRLLENKELTRLGDTRPRQVDVRVISATNSDLSGDTARGTFRRDLFYRLAPLTFTLPPLRERREDIPLLLDHILTRVCDEAGRKVRLLPETVRVLCNYDWPGNVRELENEIRKLILLAGAEGTIGPERLAQKLLETCDTLGQPGTAPALPERFSLYVHMAQLERRFIAHALAESDGIKKHAAARLGMPESTLRLKMKQYDLDVGA